MEDYIAAIDLGTTKVVTLVGRRSSEGRVQVIASSETPSQGIMRGEVLNIREVVEAVQVTLDDVRQKTGLPIKDVYVGIAGQHIRRIDSRLDSIRHDDYAEISEQEIRDMEEKMHKTKVEPGEKILHVIPQSYNVDGHLGIINPVGMPGKRVEANYRIFVGKTQSADYTNRCIQQVGLNLKQLVLEPLASAKAVLSDDEKEIGVAMVDIGGGTTDLVVYYDNTVRHTAVIPFGGNIITEDIRHGCGVLQRQANDMKIQYGSCFSDLVEDTLLVIQGVNGRESREVSFKFLSEIIEARMDEIMDTVLYEIERSGYADKLPAGIVFTGGGAMMQHLTEFVRNKTGMDVRIAKPLNLTDDSLKDVRRPSYSTAVGLLLKGIEYETKPAVKPVLEPVLMEELELPPAPQPEVRIKEKKTKPAKEPRNRSGVSSLIGNLFGEDFFKTDNGV